MGVWKMYYFKEYRNRLSLVCGAGKIKEIAEDSGL